MIKSIGNTSETGDIQRQKGADILRLWVSSVDYQADVRISQERLKQVSESYRKIRNTIRFLLANLEDFDPVKDAINENELEEIDRYMLVRLQNLVSKVKTNYDKYDFSDVFNEIHNYASNNLSTFYHDYEIGRA